MSMIPPDDNKLDPCFGPSPHGMEPTETPEQVAERLAIQARDAALYWVDDSHECDCDKCEMKRNGVIAPIDRAILAARWAQAERMHAQRCDCCDEHVGSLECLRCHREHRDFGPALDYRCRTERARLKAALDGKGEK